MGLAFPWEHFAHAGFCEGIHNSDKLSAVCHVKNTKMRIEQA